MRKKFIIRQIVFAIGFACFGLNAFGQTVVLKSDSTPATLAITNHPTSAGEKRSFSYVLSVATSKCRLTTSGTANFYRATDGETDSVYIPGGDDVKTNLFIDKSEIGTVIIELDVESKNPRYANFMVKDPAQRNDRCFGVNYASYNFYEK
jgi:hypothetical protein